MSPHTIYSSTVSTNHKNLPLPAKRKENTPNERWNPFIHKSAQDIPVECKPCRYALNTPQFKVTYTGKASNTPGDFPPLSHTLAHRLLHLWFYSLKGAPRLSVWLTFSFVSGVIKSNVRTQMPVYLHLGSMCLWGVIVTSTSVSAFTEAQPLLMDILGSFEF